MCELSDYDSRYKTPASYNLTDSQRRVEKVGNKSHRWQRSFREREHQDFDDMTLW